MLLLDPYWATNYPELNLEVIANLRAEIQSRLQNPTPEAIATLYNAIAKEQISGYGLTVAEYMKEKAWEPTECFPAHTRIQTSRTTSTAISALRVGDVVLAFDARADKGRGALVPRRVTRLYRNTTTDWIRLSWVDGTARKVITTPGHHFLDELGGFPTTPEMTRTGSATVVLASVGWGFTPPSRGGH